MTFFFSKIVGIAACIPFLAWAQVRNPSTEQATTGIIAQDGFKNGLEKWKVEAQDASSIVRADDGVLDVLANAGVTVWYRERLSGDYEIRFKALPVLASFPNYKDRISDLNLFWNAQAPGLAQGYPVLLNADGSLAAYNPLSLYYLGFGANGNKTTCLRRYDGSAARPQLLGYADPEEATALDTLGPPPAFARLHVDTPVTMRVISRAPTAGDPVTLKVFANDVLVFSYADPSPYLEGWFAFRTTTSHFKISDFVILRH